MTIASNEARLLHMVDRGVLDIDEAARLLCPIYVFDSQHKAKMTKCERVIADFLKGHLLESHAEEELKAIWKN